MNKGDIVKFSDLQIGDYFSDDKRQKCRKIPSFEYSLSDPPITFNAFHIQRHASISLSSDYEFIFIKHAAWVEEEKYGFTLTVEESELEYQLNFLDNYLVTLENFLAVEAEKESDSFDDSFGRQEIYEFVDLLRSSFFVSLYSYLETKLNNECRKGQQDNPDIKLSLEDIQGAGIRKAKTYLVKVLDTSFQFDTNSHWEQIQWYNRIRNCIVHNEGKVSDKELKKYIEGSSNLSCEKVVGGNRLVLSNSFCEEALSIIRAFLTSLLYHRQADEVT